MLHSRLQPRLISLCLMRRGQLIRSTCKLWSGIRLSQLPDNPGPPQAPGTNVDRRPRSGQSQSSVTLPFHQMPNAVSAYLINHGFFFREAQHMTYNTTNPLRRDTLSVSPNSYVVVRLITDIVGVYAFHCELPLPPVRCVEYC